jgi:CelD/BcsL family acetyltransferase involved in cellulose biosynthesis
MPLSSPAGAVRLFDEMKLLPNLRSVTLDPAALEPAWIERWNALCLHEETFNHPFLTADFAAAVSRVRPLVRVCVLLDKDVPCAFFPYQFHSRRHLALGWAEPVGGAMSDYFGVVAEPGVRFTEQGLLQAAGLNYLYFGQLDSAQAELGLHGEIPVQGLVVRFEQGAESYWVDISARDRDFAKDTRRLTRQLEERVGPLSLHFEDSTGSSTLDLIIATKRAQYERTNVSDALGEAWTRDLLHELLRSPGSACAPSLVSLRAGDQWAASHFGLRCAAGLHYWFPVYSQELNRYSPGRLLLKTLIDHGAANGLHSIDCGLGDAKYKADFANERHMLFRGVWRRSGIRAQAARVFQSLSWRMAARKPAGSGE